MWLLNKFPAELVAGGKQNTKDSQNWCVHSAKTNEFVLHQIFESNEGTVAPVMVQQEDCVIKADFCGIRSCSFFILCDKIKHNQN